MARFKARVAGLVTVIAVAIGTATLVFWQDPLLTAQAAPEDSTYVVKRGDSLAAIANKFDVSVEALAAANGLTINAPLYRKFELTIPAAASADAQVESAAAPTEVVTEEAAAAATPEAAPEEAMAEATEETVAAEATVEVAEVVASTTNTEATTEATSAERTYKVKAGDTLAGIAKQFGVTREAIIAANNLKPNSPLYRGMVLTIPSANAAPSEAPTAAVPPPAAPQATPEPTATVTEEATEEATEAMTEEPTAEATEEPTETVTEEATSEATAEMTAEATEEASAETMEEATAEPTAVMTAEATAEPTETMTEEATAEPTEETTEEAAPEATEEMLEEPTVEATAEPTAEATDEATEEATEEATDEATTEPTATEETAEVGTILSTITAMGDFTVLLEALDTAGLSATLDGEGPFTLFAPTDAAFEALPAGTIDGLLASSPDDLSQILLYHILPGKVLAEDFVDGVTVITAQGGTVTIGVTPDGLTVNDAHITISDIETSNGVIHVIDAVLLPSGGVAAVPRGTVAPATTEAASEDAASVIIVPANVSDMTAAAQSWPTPDATITLYSPVDAGGYHSPIEVVGLANTYGGNLAINLTTPDGTVLAQRMTLGGDEAFAFFQSSLRFFVDDRTAATLSVNEVDMADGSVLNAVETSITLLPGQRFLDVTMPTVGATVCPPILVSGYSNTFEANVVLTLRQPDGETLLQRPTIGGTLGFYRDFATPLPYRVDKATPLLVSVTETDASGMLSTIDETVIPVTLYPAYSAVCY